ncbi:mechanosensitive ion channel family protein [Paucisalibacillus globulus]|uniref:mechanosensitive ion channel family protein n=1 Tax=Paucisalibacillus globulus TaxID=351095 RepID=UPI000BB75E61|nr:mechanosensitive ion channel domain-containing protein [Paucisalibacillus globulus]
MDFIVEQLNNFGIENPKAVKALSVTIMILFIAILCIIANFIAKHIVIRIITHIVKRNKFQWDDILLERKVFRKLSHIVPAVIIFSFAEAETFPNYTDLIKQLAVAYIIIVGITIINSFLNAINDIYQTYEISKIRPIKGYIQVVKIVVIIIGVILVIASLIGESPLVFLSGIGALSAIFMLVFKDSILGLVAGVQLTANDMVRVGDWIEMPKYDADGDIIDISLNTVKVQNWDKTITMIPAYALISDSFKNWRGMQNAGGRRIKRSIYIDTTSIAFCTEEMVEKFKQIQILTDYISKREHEIVEYNEKNHVNRNNPVNGRAMTNIGVFRSYISNYIQRHPGINKNMTLMVRQLAPTELGLPIEIYAFTSDIRWDVYESIQADIFDHLFAVASQFELRIFQSPSGNDMRSMVEGIGESEQKRGIDGAH